MEKKQTKKMEHFPEENITKKEMDFIDEKLKQSRKKLEEKAKLYEQFQEGNLKGLKNSRIK